METKYTYKEQDITMDIMIKIEHIVNIIAKREKKKFDTAFAEFLASKAYLILQEPSNLFWTESSEFIADEYYREKD